MSWIESLRNSCDWSTFCHLDPARSFFYRADGAHSLLCHRCTGIYSAFLLLWLLAKAMNWNGRWGNYSFKVQFLVPFVLFALTALQVGLEFKGIALQDEGGFIRFFLGGLISLGLLQMSFFFDSAPIADSRQKADFSMAGLLGVALILNFVLVSRYLWLDVSLTIAGLCLLYLIMNRLVLRSFFPFWRESWLWITAAVLSGVEWGLLSFVKKWIYG